MGLIVSDYLFFEYSDIAEGELTKLRSRMVNSKSLSLVARSINLHKFLKLSHSAHKSLEKGNDSLLADALEALLAAIYLDCGFEAAKLFVFNKLLPNLLNDSNLKDTNYKSLLLELVQSKGKDSPKYIVIEEHGPDHDKEFIIAVNVDNQQLAIGKGKNKKEAEQDAAKIALDNSIFLL